VRKGCLQERAASEEAMLPREGCFEDEPSRQGVLYATNSNETDQV
jgi:hypothetical protein